MLDELADFAASQQSRLQSKQAWRGAVSCPARGPDGCPELGTGCCLLQGGPGHMVGGVGSRLKELALGGAAGVDSSLLEPSLPSLMPNESFPVDW